MIDVLNQMAVVIACGFAWQLLRPGGVELDVVKRAISALVYYLMLPALVLDVLWYAPVGVDSLRIAIVAATCVMVAALIAWLACKSIKADRPSTGAIILAASFPNATYLGLPVLAATLGSWAKGVAIQYDLFATLPLLLTFGIYVSRYYSAEEQPRQSPRMVLLEFARVPAVWAAVLAMLLNYYGIQKIYNVSEVLSMLSSAVVPLMLLFLGMSLGWDNIVRDDNWFENVRYIVPVVAIQLLIMPGIAWYVTSYAGIDNELRIAVVLEAAMPSMLIGLVLCERYKLNTPLFAMAVTVSTVLGLFTLPMWFNWMQRSLNIFYGA